MDKLDNNNLASNTYEKMVLDNISKVNDEKVAHSEHHNDSQHSDNHSSKNSSHHNGHHHHSHHHHSHHHHRSSKKKKSTIDAKTGWIIAISIFVLVTIFLVALNMLDSRNPSLSSKQKDKSSNILEVDVVNEEGVLVKNAVNEFLLVDLLNSVNSNVIPSSFSNKDGRLDEQVPVSLNLSVKEGNALSYKIEIADNDSFSNAQISYVEEATDTYEFKHLCTNTTYYYRVTVYTATGTDSVVGDFKTTDTPRILSIDGISNVRDIGNWKTDSGKRIKQGMLLRGTEMDGAVESGYHLTNEGITDMLDIFGINTDMDLRAKSYTTKDALGARVDHMYYDMVAYADIFTENGKDKIKLLFSDIANSDNYPVYLHCTYGRDRTGTVCYLLEALLGVSRGDCLKDYALSNAYISNIETLEKGLATYEGDTLKEQTEAYLMSCGVSEYQIESIRNIFLGE